MHVPAKYTEIIIKIVFLYSDQERNIIKNCVHMEAHYLTTTKQALW